MVDARPRLIVPRIWLAITVPIALTMGLAIVSMWFVMKGRGVPAPIGLPIAIAATTGVTGYVTCALLRQCGRRESDTRTQHLRNSA